MQAIIAQVYYDSFAWEVDKQPSTRWLKAVCNKVPFKQYVTSNTAENSFTRNFSELSPAVTVVQRQSSALSTDELTRLGRLLGILNCRKGYFCTYDDLLCRNCVAK